MRLAKPASRRRSRFSVASSALRLRTSFSLVAAGGDRGGSVGELVEFEQLGLVGVAQSGAFTLVVLDRVVEPLELCGDEFVLVGWRAGDHGVLGGDQLSGVEQRLTYLREDVFVELVGADVALGAATHACAGAQCARHWERSPLRA